MTDQPFGLSADPFALPATLTADQTARLIENRVRACGGDAAALFPPDTCAEIHRHTHGVTGAVCDLAGRAMRLAAAAGASSISPEHVRAAADPGVGEANATDVKESPSEQDAPATRRGESDDLPASVETTFDAVDTTPAEPAPAPVQTAAAPAHEAPAVHEAPAPHEAPAMQEAPAAPALKAVPQDPAEPDDIPDMPESLQGAFELPSEPSKDLAPVAQAWVSRFLGEGAAATPILPKSRATQRPTVREAPVPAPAPAPTPAPAAPRPAPAPQASAPRAERRRSPESALPPGSKQPDRRVSRNVPRGRSRRRSTQAISWAVATAAALCIVAILAHRLSSEIAAPPRSQAERIVAARAPALGVVTLGAESTRAGAPVPLRSVAPSARSRAAVTPGRSPEVAPESQPAPTSSRRGRLAVEVAAFIFPDRAETERQRLAAAGHPVRVVTEWENGAPSYRVVLGPYRSRAMAERAVGALLDSGLVQQARIVTLAPGQ